MQFDTSEILQQIWSLSEGDYVFLPVMRPGKIWNEGPAFYAERVQAPLWFVPGTEPSTADNYFTPLKYTETKRRREFVGRPGVLFADLDDDARLNGYEPNLLVRSSAQHQHAYWFLDQPYDLDEWEPVARGLSQALGADPGGWDATQVLRIPGTQNHKYSPPHKVSVLHYDPKTRFPLKIFPTHPTVIKGVDKREILVMATTEEAALRADALRTLWPKLSMEVQSFLTLTVDQVKNGAIRDRSKVIWFVGGALLDAGATVEQAFAIINPAPWNKYRDRPESLMAGLIKQSFQVNSPYAD